MGFIAFIIVGLVAGALAKAILPGRQGGGWLATLLLGVVGAFVGGWLSRVLFYTSPSGFIPSVIWATVGAVIVLAIQGWLAKRKQA
ncbi:MAG: GlsB/YeaQ/YmgE family stress response membrane protein [Tessaracoccus sp.]|uniref:GlsB/YeaQ/YmgE family stress response membrane protein n=1 Tax=Tessaracoccus sp. TaxID=1971211 RepID=UPI001EC25C3B|nr:GlsB/YeaQ/YmgE family stress response membrane protein [Tessaracoccus sp.]MBK7821709.1 GlsB/YeaQ/YmgE family stress response membrane protein [Tessaracoccus sp.]